MSIVLASPALRAGLIADDYLHRSILLHRMEGGSWKQPVWDLFTFVPVEARDWMREVGYLPWWSDPAVHIAFARPLSAATHVLDYALWPDSPALQHLQSLLWFGLGVALVALLYRRLHGPGLVAGMAGLLFAVEDAHVVFAGWIANRNALLCLIAGTAVVLLHLRWHRTHRVGDQLAALGALAIGLGCGEATLGAVAYVAAWQIACDDGPWPRRLAALAPYAVVIALWRLLYQAFGYGTMGSALYVDPGTSPLRFLAALAERWPLLLATQWVHLPANAWILLPRAAQLAASLAAAVVVIGLAALLAPLLRRERLARFWALGMAGALVPVCGAFPMDRLLAFAGVGAFGLLAMLFASCGVWPWEARTESNWRRRSAIVLAVLHLPLAAAAMVGGSVALPLMGVAARAGLISAPRGPEIAGQTFVFVNGNDFPVFYGRVIRRANGEAAVAGRLAQLGPLSAAWVRREDDRTLSITPDDGFLAAPADRLLASPTRLFSTGEMIDRPDYRVQVRSLTADGRPLEAGFRFRVPLEDRTLRWLYWRNGHLVEFPLPPVGAAVRLEACPLISLSD